MARKKRCDRNHAVYMLTCVPTGQRYIGITVVRGRAFQASVKIRWEGHVYHATVENRPYPIHQAIRQHGPASFQHQLLQVVRGKQTAHDLEMELVRSMQPELNVEGTEKKAARISG